MRSDIDRMDYIQAHRLEVIYVIYGWNAYRNDYPLLIEAQPTVREAVDYVMDMDELDRANALGVRDCP